MGKNRNKNSKLEKLTITFPVLIICILTRLYCIIPVYNSQETEFNFHKLQGEGQWGNQRWAKWSRNDFIAPLSETHRQASLYTKRAGPGNLLKPALNIHLQHICRYVTDQSACLHIHLIQQCLRT